MGRYWRILFLALALSLSTTFVLADNGVVGIATHHDRSVKIDGKFDDWPTEISVQRIEHYEDDNPEEGDFTAEFRAMWNQNNNVLFLAIEIQDDVLSRADHGTLYLDVRHDRSDAPALRVSFPEASEIPLTVRDPDSAFPGPEMRVAALTNEEARTRAYEWRIPLSETPGYNLNGLENPIVGLGLIYRDTDRKGEYSFISWGRRQKHHDIKSSLGDIILASSEFSTGTFHFTLSNLPHPDISPLLDLYLNGSSGARTARLTLEPLTEHILPTGSHFLVPSWDIDETQGRNTKVVSGKSTQESIILRSSTPTVSKIEWNSTSLIAPPPINRDEFYSYGVTQGFFSNPGTGIAEDPEGGIWISGLSGVTHMSNNTVHSFPWRPISGSSGYMGIAIDSETGVVCLAEQGRVSLIRNFDKLTEYGPEQGVSLSWSSKHIPIPILADKSEGGFWIGQDDGLLRVAPDMSFSKESLDTGRVSQIAFDNEGSIWIGTSAGLFVRESENEFRHAPIAFENEKENVTALAFDPDDSIWIGTSGAPDVTDGQLLKVDRETLEVVEVSTDTLPPFRKITHLSCDVDASGRKLLHVGISESRWFYRFLIEEKADGSLSLRELASAFEAGTIKDTLLDRYGVLWLVGRERVLASSPVQPYDPFFPENLDSRYAVNDFTVRKDTGALWCATSRGVIVTSPTPRVYNQESGLLTNMVNTILEDSSGKIWVGTRREIAYLDGNRFRPVDDTQGPKIREICCLEEGVDGAIWAGAATGLVRIDKNGEKEFFLRKRPITFLLCAKDGSVFLVENKQDIFRLHEGEIKRLEGFNAETVTCLAEDGDGRIWAGGYGSAPAVFNGDRFVAPPEPDLGPPVSAFSVDSITFGEKGNRWMGHKDGIFVTDGQIWQQAFGFRDRAAEVKKIVFTSENEAFLLAGIDVFRYEINPTPPSLSYADSLGGDSNPSVITALNTQESLPVQFRSQTSRALPGHMAYRYKLDGGSWEYTRSQMAVIPTPNVGAHTFLVEAIDPDLKHSDALEIPVRIRPDHSSILITFALAVAGVIGFLQVIRLIRTRGEKERKQKELEDTVSRRTAQIATANKELEKRQAVSGVLSKISARLISLNPASIGMELEDILGEVAVAIEAQRAHIYLAQQNGDLNDPEFHVDLAYEWYDESVGPMSKEMHRIYPHKFPWVKENYFRGEPSIVLNPDELPDYAAPEKALFKKMKWTSIGVVPMFVENELVGSFGFSTYANPLSWSAVLVDELRIAGEIFANALERMNQSKALHELRQDALDAEERERTRIARELHDQLGGALTGLKMHSRSLQNQLLEGSANPKQVELAERISEIIDDTLPDMRRICAELRPAILDDLELPQALKWQVDQFEKHTNIPCSLEVSTEDFPEQEMNRDVAIYRITQELLTNVIRHSEADRVNITLERKNDALLLRVSDNGKGIKMKELAKMKDKFGLRGIRERAEHLGGSISIIDTDGKGCTVEATIPIGSVHLQNQAGLPLRPEQFSI